MPERCGALAPARSAALRCMSVSTSASAWLMYDRLVEAIHKASSSARVRAVRSTITSGRRFVPRTMSVKRNQALVAVQLARDPGKRKPKVCSTSRNTR